MSSATAKGKNIRFQITVLAPKAFLRPRIWKSYANELPFKCIFRKKKMQQQLTEEWLSWHFIYSTCCPGRGLKENLQIKSGSSTHEFVTSPQMTVLKGFLALKLSSAFHCDQSTLRVSRLAMARSTFPGKGKSIVSASTLGQMLMVTPGLRRSCGLVLSPFSLQLRDKAYVCSLFMNNLWTTRGSPWYNINNLRKKTPHKGENINYLVLPGLASRSLCT